MKKEILLIDDDAEEHELFCMAIEKYNHHISCKHATNCNEGLKLALAEHPDIIFLDYNMPVINGYECLKHIKGYSSLKELPVYMYSASSVSSEYKNLCIEAGAKGWINKPQDLESYHRLFCRIHYL